MQKRTNVATKALAAKKKAVVAAAPPANFDISQFETVLRPNMGQAERDRYNIARGGVAGLKELILKKKPAGAAGTTAPASGTPGATTTTTVPGAPGTPALPMPSRGQVPATFDGVLNEFIRRMDEANAANIDRAGEIKGGYDGLIKALQDKWNGIETGWSDRYKRGMGMLEGMGLQEAADINEAANANQGNINQSLINSGLAGTTVAGTMRMGNERQRTAELARLNERLRKEKVGTDAALSGDLLGAQAQGIGALTDLGVGKLGFLERITQQGPDMGLLAGLLTEMGKAGMGPGSGGAGGGTGGPGTGPVAGGPGVGAPGGGVTRPAGPVGGGQPISKPHVKIPGGNIGAGTNRPLTEHEKGVLAMGGIVPGYVKPHPYTPLMGGTTAPGLKLQGPTHKTPLRLQRTRQAVGRGSGLGDLLKRYA